MMARMSCRSSSSAAAAPTVASAWHGPLRSLSRYARCRATNAMVTSERDADYIAGAGAAAFGGLASLLIWLAVGAGSVVPYAWVAIMLALIFAMKLAPARVANALIAVCY